MKRLEILGKALRGLGLEEEIISLGSYSGRRIDMLSYSRKILNLFFGWLSDEILRQGVVWEGVDQSERYRIVDDLSANGNGDEADKKIAEIFDDIFISISGNRKTGKGVAKGKVGDGAEVVIKEFDIDSLGEEGKNIFLKADSHFTFKFFISYSPNTGGFREGGVAMSDGVIGYARIIGVDAGAGYIARNISKIYSSLLSTMVHEHTHVQQYLLAEELGDVKPGFIEKRHEEGKRTDLVDLIDKNRLNMPDEEIEDIFGEEEPEEDIESGSEEYPHFASEKTMDQKISEMNDYIDRFIRPKYCPELNAAAKKEGREVIEGGGFYGLIDIMRSRYVEECFKIRDETKESEEDERKNDLKNRARSYHSTEKTRLSKFVEYYNRQHEIEAHIRGWRAQMAAGSDKLSIKNLAQYFNANFKRFSEKDFPKAELAKLWDKYKATYRVMNYPEKYLGTDEEALIVKKRSAMQELFGI